MLTHVANQGEFDVEAIYPVALSADSDKYIRQVDWACLDEAELA